MSRRDAALSFLSNIPTGSSGGSTAAEQRGVAAGVGYDSVGDEGPSSSHQRRHHHCQQQQQQQHLRAPVRSDPHTHTHAHVNLHPVRKGVHATAHAQGEAEHARQREPSADDASIQTSPAQMARLVEVGGARVGASDDDAVLAAQRVASADSASNRGAAARVRAHDAAPAASRRSIRAEKRQMAAAFLTSIQSLQQDDVGASRPTGAGALTVEAENIEPALALAASTVGAVATALADGEDELHLARSPSNSSSGVSPNIVARTLMHGGKRNSAGSVSGSGSGSGARAPLEQQPQLRPKRFSGEGRRRERQVRQFGNLEAYIDSVESATAANGSNSSTERGGSATVTSTARPTLRYKMFAAGGFVFSSSIIACAPGTTESSEPSPKEREASEYRARHRGVVASRRKQLMSFADELESQAPLYNPELLDNPRLHGGKNRMVIRPPGVLLSVIPFVKSKDLEVELNEQFFIRYEWLKEHELTLSKIRHLKTSLIDVADESGVSFATLAAAFVYFERLVLRHRVNKWNRRLVAAVCLVLAVKFVEEKTFELATVFGALERHLDVSQRAVLGAEFGVLADLKFALAVPVSHVHAHYTRVFEYCDDHNIECPSWDSIAVRGANNGGDDLEDVTSSGAPSTNISMEPPSMLDDGDEPRASLSSAR